MAEPAHEQLWRVCQRKPGEFEPYEERVRLAATDCFGGCKVVPHPETKLVSAAGLEPASHPLKVRLIQPVRVFSMR
jgi:hypothetical protein